MQSRVRYSFPCSAWNVFSDALRPCFLSLKYSNSYEKMQDAERPKDRSHAERRNEAKLVHLSRCSQLMDLSPTNALNSCPVNLH